MLTVPTNKLWLLEHTALEHVREMLRTIAADPTIAQRVKKPDGPTRQLAAKSRAGQSADVAVLPLVGILEGHQSLIGALMGGTGLDRFKRDFESCVYSSGVSAILILCDSPGGSADGVEELADTIRSARGSKPIVAAVDSMCCSACYWIASACDEITMTPSGTTASIGVYMLHVSYARALDQEGIDTTMVRQPVNKAAGNPWEPLSDVGRELFAGIVDTTYSKFVSAVAAGRGVRPSVVREKYGGGLVMLADEAKRAGVVDRIETADDTYGRLASGYQPSRRASAQASGKPGSDWLADMEAADRRLGRQPTTEVRGMRRALAEQKDAEAKLLNR